MNYKQILELVYIEKKYSEVRELLKNSSDIRSFNMLGKICLWEGKLKEAYNYFKQSKSVTGCCYCKILSGNLKEAKILIELVKGASPVINWLTSLINILEDKDEKYPSYFEIRNFYEQDLELFFKYKKKDYIKKLFNKINHLEYFNREIYKYTGRVFLNNKMLKEAEYLLKKSVDIYYQDPETHYLLGELYLVQKNRDKAIKEFEISSKANTRYQPAENKLKDLSN